MLRRIYALQGGNVLPTFCSARWLGTTHNPVRASVMTTSRLGTLRPAPSVVAKPLKALKKKMNTVLLLSRQKKKQTGEGVAVRKAVSAKVKKTKTTGRRVPAKPLKRQPFSSRKKPAAVMSQKSKLLGRPKSTGARKGRPHAHAVQKKKYNKRVAAIAKLWRMQKKKTSKVSAPLSKK